MHVDELAVTSLDNSRDNFRGRLGEGELLILVAINFIVLWGTIFLSPRVDSRSPGMGR